MANSKTVWVGQDANLRIEQIQPATIANKHISKYVFYSAYEGLTGVGELTASSTTVHAKSSVRSKKTYPITSYLLYSHKFVDNNTTFATSNKVITELTVQQPLNETSLIAVSPKGNNEVWSNEGSTIVFNITPIFSIEYEPYNKACYLISDSTNPSNKWGSIQNIDNESLSEGIDIGWQKTTGPSTDLGKESHDITISIQSQKGISAATTRTIEGRTATFVVKNAVTALNGLTNRELYAGSTAVTETVIITPDKPYSKKLVLVNEGGQEASGNSITSEGGAKVSLSGQTITLDASAVKANTPTQTIKFKVHSSQGAVGVSTEIITFTVNAVANITDQSVVEGQSISVSPGIGVIHTATIDSGNTAISISKSGENLSIKGLAVDADTNWSITVTNAAGAHATISGKTTYLANVSTSINTGDYIIIGTELLAGLTTNFEIVSGPSKGTASITSDGKLKYEASTANGPINAGTYAIKVKGANGATQTVNIAVNNITATLS